MSHSSSSSAILLCVLAVAAFTPAVDAGRALQQTTECSQFLPHCLACRFRATSTGTRAFCIQCDTGYNIRMKGRACWCAPGLYLSNGECKPCGQGYWCPGASSSSQYSAVRNECGDHKNTTNLYARSEAECCKFVYAKVGGLIWEGSSCRQNRCVAASAPDGANKPDQWFDDHVLSSWRATLVTSVAPRPQSHPNLQWLRLGTAGLLETAALSAHTATTPLASPTAPARAALATCRPNSRVPRPRASARRLRAIIMCVDRRWLARLGFTSLCGATMTARRALLASRQRRASLAPSARSSAPVSC